MCALPPHTCASLRLAERAKAPVPTLASSYSRRARLHAVVIRAAAAFRWHPGDDLIGVGDVAGFAVDAVGGVQADALAVWLACVVDHFVDVSGTEILAGAAEFFHAARVADIGIVDNQMRGLVFFVLGARVVEVSEFVEGEFAVPFCGPEQVSFGSS